MTDREAIERNFGIRLGKNTDKGLPPKFKWSHGAYYHRTRTKWTRLSSDLAEALHLYYTEMEPMAPLMVEYARVWMEAPMQRARVNARKRGIAFELTPSDGIALAERSGGVCELTGIPFRVGNSTAVKNRRPYIPSIDRIDSCGAYTTDNVRLILGALNIALGAWGDDIFEEIARAFLASRDENRNGKMQRAA